MATLTAFAQAALAKLQTSAKDPAFWTGAVIAFLLGKLI